jgi:glycosyltransferase involved in cell wall biosynthesis
MKRAFLIDALAARFGGTAYAAVQLARHLARDPEASFVLVVTRRGSIVHRGLAHVPNVRCLVLPARSRIELGRRIAWEAIQLPRIVEREAVDVVVSMSGMLPRILKCDVICLLFNPVMYERLTAANVLRRVAVRRTARRAARIVAPSRSLAGLASRSIRRECVVAPLGVDHKVFRPACKTGSEILYVADFYLHKRHELVLDAWLLLPSRRPRLHFIGRSAVNPREYERLRRRIDTLADRDLVTIDHEVNLRQLVAAYQRARVFVVASERESFCMPLVECMACGVPPVVREVPSLRETGGDGATYVQGDEPVAWTAAIRKLLEDSSEFEKARERAVQTAAYFSWDVLTNAVTASAEP